MKLPMKRLLLTAAVVAAVTVCGVISSLAAEAKLAQNSVNSLRLRSQPTIDSAELDKLATGTVFLVLEELENGEWYKVIHNFKTGYLYAPYVKFLDDTVVNYFSGYSVGNAVNVRTAPSLLGRKITQLYKNDPVMIVGTENGWHRIIIDGVLAYSSADYVKPGEVQTEPKADSSGTNDIYAQLVAYAKQFLGRKYVYGANGPNTFDCSGYTKYIYAHFGYTINRSAATQLSNGRKVEKNDLKVGDLVFFKDSKVKKAAASHVGMYIGNNQFIHASSSGGSVVINSLSDSYYSKYYSGARRII